MSTKRHTFILLLILVTESSFAEWGKHATLLPNKSRIESAFFYASRDTMTWLPILVGSLFYISGRDGEIAENVYNDSPVFGNPINADDESDRYRGIADAAWITSMLLTDSGEDVVTNKTQGMFVQIGAVNLALATSNSLKSIVARKPPIESKTQDEGKAFTSNHAVQPFAQAALTRENMHPKNTRVSPWVGHSLTALAYVGASGSAWGRVEAGGHHVSDQLVGAGIGNFVALFINELFSQGSNTVTVTHNRDQGANLVFSMRY